MQKTFDIYFGDLNDEAKKQLLDTFETSEEDENWDVFPIAVVEREV